MTEKRSVSFNQYTIEIVGKAAEMWPESADNFSGLVQSIIADWDRIRAGGGGKTQRINERLDRHESLLLYHSELLRRLCEQSGVEVPNV